MDRGERKAEIKRQVEVGKINKIKRKAEDILSYIHTNNLDKKGYGSIKETIKEMNEIINQSDIEGIKKFSGFNQSLSRWYIDDSIDYENSPLLQKFRNLNDTIEKL